MFACHKNRLFLDCSANVTLIGDWFCNDETNNADCNYDGGDCSDKAKGTDFVNETAI